MALVITGYAACNGLGRDTEAVKKRLLAGERGLTPCPLDVPFETVCGVVPGELPVPPSTYAQFDSRVLRIALLAYEELAARLDQVRARVGGKRLAAVFATSTGGIGVTEDAYEVFLTSGAIPASHDLKKQHQFSAFTNVICSVAGIEGPRYVVSTACSSSGKALASAQRLIDADFADAVLVAGVDSLCHTTVRGFHSLGVLAPIPCRPFGADRPGMNVGEGAGYLLLEKDGDGPRLLGVGESSDAFHMSAPEPEGAGAEAAMRAALSQAGLGPSDVDHVNAHGTGTRANDVAEAKAIGRLFGQSVPVVSTKGYSGHTLGAGGATEAVFSILSLMNDRIPPSLGADPVDPEVQVQIATQAIDRPLKVVLSNSFAFGGSNVSVLFGKPS